MADTIEAASKLRLALRQLETIQADPAITPQQLDFIRTTLTGYLKRLEEAPESLASVDLHLASRLVVEYWPISISAGDAVISAEHAVQKFVKALRNARKKI